MTIKGAGALCSGLSFEESRRNLMAIKMVKVRILSAHYQNGKVCKKGDVVEITEAASKEAIWLKRAELYVEPAKEEKPARQPAKTEKE